LVAGQKESIQKQGNARGVGVALALAAVIAAALLGRDLVPLPIGGPSALEQAGSAIEAGDADAALRALAKVPGMERLPLLARAYELKGDTAAAVASWIEAAELDDGGGDVAFEAAERLQALGRLVEAADAYLYAASGDRTSAEVDRIVGAQEAIGLPQRGARVRALYR
jgi:hypothetical protein